MVKMRAVFLRMSPMKFSIRRMIAGGCLLAGLLAMQACQQKENAPAPAPQAGPPESVTLNAEQALHISVATAGERAFAPRVLAPGHVAFDQNHLAQVASPWAGRVQQVFVQAGDAVRRGQPLFSVASPDLAQAEGALIGAQAAWTQAQATLQRAQGLAQAQANAPRDLEQARAEEQSAAGAYQAARQALRLYGKSEAEIDRIAAARQVKGELRIASPMDGRVATRAIAPGTLVQPGDSPAPMSIAASSSLWLVADVAEADAAQVRVGQMLTATLPALPGRTLEGRLDYVASASDAGTHRVAVRATLRPAPAGLLPQMLADVTLHTGEAARQVAVPLDAVVRESDGTRVIFATADGRTFTRRPVQLDEPQDGYYPVRTGVQAGERIATSGALFLSNALALLAQ